MLLNSYRLTEVDPRPQFLVNLSDLTPKIISELKEIDDVQVVLRQAVGRIFENIHFRLYHLSIVKVLSVRLVE